MRRAAFWLALVLVVVLLPVRHGEAEVGDISFQRKSGAAGGDYPPAIFPHWVHRMQFRCYVCHDDIFTMKAGSNRVTMDAIEQRKSCGTCHNGKIAFGVSFDTCPRCHHP